MENFLKCSSNRPRTRRVISVRIDWMLEPLLGRLVLTSVWRRDRNVQIEAQV